jgi:protoporphyrin/coproporphyrin ferrochelatase
MPKRAVLLVNLGSPDSTAVPDVLRYLQEFLGDERVIDKPDSPFLRRFLVNRIITPKRAPKSAEAYRQIWTENGSPLIVISQSVREKLAAALGADTPVYLAMRYGRPAITDVLNQIAADGVTELLLFPQYPHYATSSWETVVVKVYEEAARVAPSVRIACVQPFYDDHDYIEALYAVSRAYLSQPYDHVLFSYHGIPVRHLRKADASLAHCTMVSDCCATCSPAHATCYRAQVFKTTEALARRAQLAPGTWSVSFQSRLAGEPWLSPYTDTEFERFAREGKKRLVVLTPAFVADCLETLEEIAGEGREQFLHAGGEAFQHVPCLNDQPPYIEFIAARVRRWLGGEKPAATHFRAAAATQPAI